MFGRWILICVKKYVGRDEGPAVHISLMIRIASDIYTDFSLMSDMISTIISTLISTALNSKDEGPDVTMISSDLYALQFSCTDVY